MGILGVSKIWITVGPIMVINAVLLVSLITYTLTKHTKSRDIPESASRSRSKFLSVHLKEWWVWTTDPIAHMFVKLRMGPNLLSMIGFLLSVVAGFLFAKGLFGYAGWVMIFGATFDIFDGRVARLSGRETRSGSYFDSVLDRFSEGVCFIGLAYFFRASWLLPFVVAGLVGSMAVSYTKARAESVGVECKVGSMQRPERIVYLGVASIFTPAVTILLYRWWTNPLPILVIGAVLIIAVMTNATAIYRMIHTMNELDTADEREKESIPQIITKLSTPEGRNAFWEKARYGYDRSRSQYSHVVLFMVDGIQSEILNEFIARGDMPNMSRYIAERGSKIDVSSTFPSTTGTSSTPFVTGCFPGTCDIPGVTWFDRSIPEGRILTMNRFRDYLGWGAYAMDHDLSKTVQTIFEYSRRAVNIFGVLNRGCGLIRDPAFFRLYSTFRRAKKKTDAETVFGAADLWFAEALRRHTDFIFYALPPLDFVREGDDVGRALESYKRMDEAIGKAVGHLKASGIYDKSALIFSSGYGLVDAKNNFDLNKFLRKRYHLFTHPGKPREWLEADAIAAQSGSSMMNIYLRRDGSWNEQNFFEEVERRGLVGALLERDEVDVLAGRSAEGGVIVASRRGRAHLVEDPDGRITYMTKGGEPLGFGLPQIMKGDDPLVRTFDSDYPDGIVQLLQLFRSQRSGDIVISVDPNCSLGSKANIERDPATSGSLHRSHIRVPLITSVPVSRSEMRTADVFKLILDLLGIEAMHGLDGRKTEVRIQNAESRMKNA